MDPASSDATDDVATATPDDPASTPFLSPTGADGGSSRALICDSFPFLSSPPPTEAVMPKATLFGTVWAWDEEFSPLLVVTVAVAMTGGT